ncbi:MAG: hypothetical protein HY537_00970 [Deltaproteobacteria bacterium]|nr:hypothetical protein [Deltaproteobacteria bacterium]
MENTKPTFYIELGSQWKKRLVRAELDWKLDAPAFFTATVALDGKSVSSLQPSTFPKTTTLRWGDKEIFKGHLLSASISGHSRADFVFSDGLYLAKKISENEFMKHPFLQDTLSKIAGLIGLAPRFAGSLNESLPSFNFGGRPLYEHLIELSANYGFHFVCRSVSENLAIIRFGSTLQTVNLNCKSNAAHIAINQAAHSSYEEVELRYFGPGQSDAKEKKIGSLSSPLSSMTNHPSFSEKKNWKLGYGRLEAYVTDQYHFESGDKLFRNQISKRWFEQEQLQVTCYQPLALPGDGLSVSNAPAGSAQNGNYLVKDCHIVVGSCHPKMELLAIRP